MAETSIAVVVAQCGGCATLQELRRVFSERTIRRAVRKGILVRLRRDQYALPGLGDAQRAASRAGAFLSHRSAALAHGLGVWTEPRRPELVVPRHRRVPIERRKQLDLRYRALAAGDVEGNATTPLRTVVDCARDLPLVEALAVADSALRSGAVTETELATVSVGRTGRAATHKTLALASAQAANPFESAVRALTIEAVGPIFVPQVAVQLGSQIIHPDLACPKLRIAIEADSFTYHTSRSQIRSDCWRHDSFALAEWMLLRFAWDQAMHTPDWVREVVAEGVSLRRRRVA